MALKTSLANKSLLRICIAIALSLGLLFLQALQWTGAYAQAPGTPEPTETTFKISGQGNFCGPGLAQLYLNLQYTAISATRSVRGALCGRLVLIKDFKTGKNYLGLVPCNRNNVYILGQRPRELLNYYQFVGVKTGKGKKVYSKEFGEITQYINQFDTYYPLDQCSSCGILPGSAPISPPEFVFPGSTPTQTPTPLLMASQSSRYGLAGGFLGFSARDYQFDVSTPFPASPALGEPSPTPVVPQPLSASEAEKPSLVSTPTPVVFSAPTQTAGPVAGLDRKTKPPTSQPFDGKLLYGLYTFLLVPLFILAMIWKRTRLG